MHRMPLMLAVLLAALALTACGDVQAYKGDPKCFADDSKDNTCTSSEGVLYRVVDRDSIGTLPGALSVRLARGPLPSSTTTVFATVELTPRGPYDGDVAIQQKNGTLFIPKTRVRKGKDLELTWTLPKDAVSKLGEYPSFMTFSQSPDECPGGKAQCFVYMRLWK